MAAVWSDEIFNRPPKFCLKSLLERVVVLCFRRSSGCWLLQCFWFLLKVLRKRCWIVTV